jgi:hypothetical protein
LSSAAIDYEGTLRACVEVEERKRERAMPEPSGGGSGGSPLKYHLVYTPYAPTFTAVLGQPPTVPATAAGAMAVPLHPYYTTTVDISQAIIAAYTY